MSRFRGVVAALTILMAGMQNLLLATPAFADYYKPVPGYDAVAGCMWRVDDPRAPAGQFTQEKVLPGCPVSSPKPEQVGQYHQEAPLTVYVFTADNHVKGVDIFGDQGQDMIRGTSLAPSFTPQPDSGEPVITPTPPSFFVRGCMWDTEQKKLVAGCPLGRPPTAAVGLYTEHFFRGQPYITIETPDHDNVTATGNKPEAVPVYSRRGQVIIKGSPYEANHNNVSFPVPGFETIAGCLKETNFSTPSKSYSQCVTTDPSDQQYFSHTAGELTLQFSRQYGTPSYGEANVYSAIGQKLIAGTPLAGQYTPDTTAPVVTSDGLVPFAVDPRVYFSYSATDDKSGVETFDVRYRQAPYNGVFSSYIYPAAWQRTQNYSVDFVPPQGSSVCLSVRSTDAAANMSNWSGERCTAVALDDRSMTASTGWTQVANSSYYRGTATTAARTGLTLTRTGVQTRRLALVASTCRGCGIVGFYWNGHLLKQFNLNSGSGGSTYHRQVLSVTAFPTPTSGTVVIKSLNAGRIYIDGLAVSRT